MSGELDEVYERMRRTGPEFDGWLSNHGPMAADAVLRLGAPVDVHAWLDGYADRLEEAPVPRWPIAPDEWREVLGDPSRLGDWTAYFDRELADRAWTDVLTTWWPRLLADPPAGVSVDELISRAAAHGDEHVLEFAEVAVEAAARGVPTAVGAGLRAVALVG